MSTRSRNKSDSLLEDISELGELCESPARSLRPRRKSGERSNSGTPEKSSSRRASIVPHLEGIVEEKGRSDEGENDENIENVDDRDEGEAIVGSEMLAESDDVVGRDMFGFSTPRKGRAAMAAKVQQQQEMQTDLNKTPKHHRTPLSQKNTPARTPLKTPVRSSSNTPVKGILKTPGSGAKRGGAHLQPETPASARKRVKKTLIRIAEKDETRYISSESEGDDDEESQDGDESDGVSGSVLSSKPPTPQTPARKGRRGIRQARELNTDTLAESYFEAQATKVRTSDRTLSKLKTPRLSEADVSTLLRDSELKYQAEIMELLSDHRAQFPKWLSLLHRGFNIVTYGLGSKKSLIHSFHEKYLIDYDCVVVNGFFPSLTLKSILSTITDDILELDGSGGDCRSGSLEEQVDGITRELETAGHHLYILIHNIDGVTLRSEKTQATLASLAAHPLVHLVCSIDHINAPLIWDQDKLSKLNLIWFDCTTFLPYSEETAGSRSLMVRQSGALALSSLSSVWASLTPNAKKIYTIILKYQIENMDSDSTDGYLGFSLMELYRLCRLEFLVPSDLALRAQLTEFRDHKLVKSKKGSDGGEYLTIPLDKPTLTAFLETI